VYTCFSSMLAASTRKSEFATPRCRFLTFWGARWPAFRCQPSRARDVGQAVGGARHVLAEVAPRTACRLAYKEARGRRCRGLATPPRLRRSTSQGVAAPRERMRTLYALRSLDAARTFEPWSAPETISQPILGFRPFRSSTSGTVSSWGRDARLRGSGSRRWCRMLGAAGALG